jgi:hypothetical protein
MDIRVATPFYLPQILIKIKKPNSPKVDIY